MSLTKSFNKIEFVDRLNAARDRVEVLNSALAGHHRDLGKAGSGMQILCGDIPDELTALSRVIHPDEPDDT